MRRSILTVFLFVVPMATVSADSVQITDLAGTRSPSIDTVSVEAQGVFQNHYVTTIIAVPQTAGPARFWDDLAAPGFWQSGTVMFVWDEVERDPNGSYWVWIRISDPTTGAIVFTGPILEVHLVE